MDVIKWACRNCGETIGALTLLSLMQEAGARVYPSPSECSPGKIHNFVDPDLKNETAIAKAKGGSK